MSYLIANFIGQENYLVGSMLNRLQRIVQEVSQAPDIQHALDLIAERLVVDLIADACTIFLASTDDAEELIL